MTSSPVSVVPVEAPKEEPLELSLLAEVEKNQPWICPASAKSIRTVNPIRAIVDPIVANMKTGEERGDGKDLISLALGDPTVAGNLPPCPVALTAVETALQSQGHAAGYVNACGVPAAREAIARFHNAKSADAVVIANGCSGALELALTALLDPGTVLLVPSPGFPLYQVIAESHGASVVHYRLLPDQNWECDLRHMEELLGLYGPHRVRGILVNNPCNPTGAVFSRAHLEQLVAFAERHRLPIVADEVYGDLTFQEHPFHPMACVASGKVPVITASGLAKQFLVPGWRVGWIVFHDNVQGSLREVEAGAKRLAQVVLGASHLVQMVVPKILDSNNQELRQWKADLKLTLEEQAKFLSLKLKDCPGLEVKEPQGAMYFILRIHVSKFGPAIQSDLDFSSLLLQEENVFVLPGIAFGVPGFFRVVFCGPATVLEQATKRIQCFCERHFQAS
ncbi:Bifunctional aspartate aminotransferase and glutamate/aspartate-prephenate aminotransferase [Seminavis robusta]|uniref:Bifunctional aspartate aminotransferase and glutamate/aspartate-prephenate aminotransferase n=1 Tax=Seminavis robusta TaxID=568900 RepID=A0A9N8DUF4_9STRA|nr:Bifunctional aspartate aminotransferase and glutamate/aspartate-prephenate aminotransferase [Seminavis robusta]|eukprot:Sro379_g130480.1 Bifunctional aspartate aminotransferase and glutamate/aspartate-prephenate aminotransferase (450) ;mRNA; f:42761-44357